MLMFLLENLGGNCIHIVKTTSFLLTEGYMKDSFVKRNAKDIILDATKMLQRNDSIGIKFW